MNLGREVIMLFLFSSIVREYKKKELPKAVSVGEQTN